MSADETKSADAATGTDPNHKCSHQLRLPLPHLEADFSEVLVVDEVAALLRVNRKTIYGMVERNELRGVRGVGRSLRFSRSAVLEWLAEGQGRVSRKKGRRRA
ncbi:helix-turn-helix domain-containing protein [Myxococcota bacterium]